MQKAVAANNRLVFLRVLCLIIIEIATYIPVLALLNHFFTAYNQAIGSNYVGITLSFIGGATYRSIFFILISSGYFFLLQYLSQRAKAGALERENLEKQVHHETVLKDLALAKNAYLRAQMNPHLFFNSLSFIHRRIRKTDKVAGDMIVTLSDMMRYAIESNYSQEMITLSEEVEQVENLVSVFRTIHSDKFNLTLEYEEKLLSTTTIPLVLITLVENMYKHGELSNMQLPGKIMIYQSENMLTIHSQNQVSKESKAPSLATGLQNLKKRLKDVYQDEVTINWTSKSNIFELQIDLPLQKVDLHRTED
ncbi:sensor histidine kinase [Pedobacter agri]|uniref:Histidine kinase n=1 Tax=Pedobacter agri TaxID=454586 RepID=A0A9X3DCQ2_9SPHI|nr:histidine kinase [Pedobacter agri]MCX3264907.1 histidine kinase [Pedobacter agri]